MEVGGLAVLHRVGLQRFRSGTVFGVFQGGGELGDWGELRWKIETAMIFQKRHMWGKHSEARCGRHGCNHVVTVAVPPGPIPGFGGRALAAEPLVVRPGATFVAPLQ